jgi:3-phosphoshikimate 1-carboxyvinyltransferase
LDLLLKSTNINSQRSVKVSGSKSETNRLLLLQALYPNLILENTSDSDDSEVMVKALRSNETVIDVHHAGTAMRFLTTYFAIQEGKEVVLTGSPRMKERPIKILVEALLQLGAEITYEENEGFPPIRIKGKKLIENKVALSANVSSQYISALLLIAPKLKNGLDINLEGRVTSFPYIRMTLGLLNEIGVETAFAGNLISVKPKLITQNLKPIIVESDWSSASYFYSIISLSEIGKQITLSNYKKESFQGDSVLAEIYKDFGVETTFNGNSILLRKIKTQIPETFNSQLNNAPDIAQTIAVTCFGLGIGCHLTGLHTLKIKETDRLQALKNELEKLGGKVAISDDSFTLGPYSPHLVDGVVKIKTYQDHRMAMAFAPLALKMDITIEDAEVVSKSYPTFWEDLKSIGFKVSG